MWKDMFGLFLIWREILGKHFNISFDIFVVQLLSHVHLLCDPMDCSISAYPCPSPSPGFCSNSCPVSQWCHPTISSSVTPSSSCSQSFPASESFPMSLTLHIRSPKYWSFSFLISLPMNIQGWFLLWLTSLISLLPKGLSRVFSNSIVLILVVDLFYALDQVENVPLYFSYIEFLLHTGVNFYHILFHHLLRWSYGLLLWSVNMTKCIDWLSNINHSWNKSHMVTMYL